MLNVPEFHLISKANNPNIAFNGIGNNTHYPQNNLKSH